jgi:hypothetical protein
LKAKLAKQQSVIEDRRQTGNKVINNALLGCHYSNNTPEEQCFINQYYCRLYYTGKFQGTFDAYS